MTYRSVITSIKIASPPQFNISVFFHAHSWENMSLPFICATFISFITSRHINLTLVCSIFPQETECRQRRLFMMSNRVERLWPLNAHLKAMNHFKFSRAINQVYTLRWHFWILFLEVFHTLIGGESHHCLLWLIQTSHLQIHKLEPALGKLIENRTQQNQS